jgi:hypothetical protein
MFSTLKDKNEYDPPLRMNSPCFDHKLDVKCLVEQQDQVDRAVLYRIKKQDNTYLHVVDADPKDLFLMHTDNLPFFRKRMKLWGWYL